MLDELKPFPTIAAAWTHSNPSPANAKHLRMLLDAEADGFPSGMREVDGTLAALLTTQNITALDEQVRALFADERQWEKANSELLALQYFAGRGQLISTGWPTTGFGDTPPFDGRARVGTIELPFDIKPAKGSTFQWLRDALQPTIDTWVAGRWAVEVTIKTHGTFARQLIVPHRRKFIADLKAKLATATATLPLELTVTAEATTVGVIIAEQSVDQVTVSTHIGSPAARAEAVGDTMLEHIENKARLAHETGAPGFFLVYVRPHSSGAADFTPTVFADLQRHVLSGATAIEHSPLWLATLYLDWTPRRMMTHVFCNSAAAWPAGIDGDILEGWVKGA